MPYGNPERPRAQARHISAPMPTSTTVSTAGNHGSQQNFALQVRHPPHPPSKTARPAHSHLTPLARLPAQDLLKEAAIVAQGHGGGLNSGKPEQFSGKRARWHVAESPESPATAVKLKYVAQPRPPPEVTEGSKVSAREKLQHIHTVLRVNRRAIFEMGLRVKELQVVNGDLPAEKHDLQLYVAELHEQICDLRSTIGLPMAPGPMPIAPIMVGPPLVYEVK